MNHATVPGPEALMLKLKITVPQKNPHLILKQRLTWWDQGSQYEDSYSATNRRQ